MTLSVEDCYQCLSIRSSAATQLRIESVNLSGRKLARLPSIRRVIVQPREESACGCGRLNTRSLSRLFVQITAIVIKLNQTYYEQRKRQDSEHYQELCAYTVQK